MKTEDNLELSIIIPVYNAERTIRKTLECILSSTYKDYEVIVVNDCSTDRSEEAISKYPVRLINMEKNSGPAACRNKGAAEARGEILLFMDSDIQFGPHLIMRMVTEMNENKGVKGVGTVSSPEPLNGGFFPRYFAICDYQVVKVRLDRSGVFWGHEVITRCGTIRKGTFREIGGFNEGYKKSSIEDREFSSRLHRKHTMLVKEDFVVQHHYPGSLGKIARRYLRNSIDASKLLVHKRVGIKYRKTDFVARFLLVISTLSLILGFSLHHWYFSVVFPGTLLTVVLMKIDLFNTFYRFEGLRFTGKAFIIYFLTSFLITAGVLKGFTLSVLNVFLSRVSRFGRFGSSAKSSLTCLVPFLSVGAKVSKGLALKGFVLKGLALEGLAIKGFTLSASKVFLLMVLRSTWL